jgi:hypothetical protein
VRVTAKPYLHDGSIAFTDTSVAGADGVTGAALSALVNTFGIRIPLRSIPFDVRLKSLSTGPDGVVISLIGQNLVYDS